MITVRSSIAAASMLLTASGCIPNELHGATGGMGGGGSSGTGDAGGTGGAIGVCQICDEGCVDVASDDANCGACGHDCQGAACSGGLCERITLVDGQDMPLGIAVAGGTVYWAHYNHSMGEILSCTVGGCNGSPSLVAGGADFPYGVAVGGGLVYWANRADYGFPGTIASCPLGGCAGAPAIAAPMQDRPTWLQIAGDDIYWMTASQVMKLSLAGTPSPKVVLDGGTNALSAFVVDLPGQHLYWADQLGVAGCALAGCSRTALAGDFAHAMVHDGTRLYYLGTSGLHACDGATCKLLSPNLVGGSSSRLLVDGSTLYASTGTGVYRCALPDCADLAQVAYGGMIGDIAVDATSLYWTDEGVFKVAK